mmetsp:Transcript_17057/g.34470  ORF Transcript_17057/g.34470 Transcript_17057/m.34470 type:complete len:481 (-) Transcript_17057:177-1619(-)
MRSLKVALLPLLATAAVSPFCSAFAPTSSRPATISPSRVIASTRESVIAYASSSDNQLNLNNNDDNNPFQELLANNNLGKIATSSLLALTLTFSSLSLPTSTSTSPSTIPPANAADGAAIGLCLLKKCQLPLAKCILNPNCLANVICINTCNGKPDETGCQIDCGNIFENDVVGEFNKCAVSDMTCVPQRPDDGSYPIPPKEKLVKKFDTKLFNGRWYITAGQNKLFDTFPCQVHFFTETEKGKFFGKLNWRIQEPDGEFFTRDALQKFVQDPKNPAHMINHDNEYLHYKDDWYIVDYAEDGNKEGVPPFAFVYYRGENDAWIGYGGAVVYTRDSKLPESLKPRLRKAAQKVNFDFDKDFEITDNSCKALEKGEEVVLREKFAGKMAIQTEKQLQQQAVVARTAATNSVRTEVGVAEKAFITIEAKAVQFEKELVKDIEKVEKEFVKDVVKVEEEIEKEEKEIFGGVKSFLSNFIVFVKH